MMIIFRSNFHNEVITGKNIHAVFEIVSRSEDVSSNHIKQYILMLTNFKFCHFSSFKINGIMLTQISHGNILGTMLTGEKP